MPTSSQLASTFLTPWCHSSHLFSPLFNLSPLFLSSSQLSHLFPPSFTENVTQRNFCTQKFLHTEAFTHNGFPKKSLLRGQAFAQRNICTDVLAHTASFVKKAFTQNKLFYTEKILHRETFAQSKLFHTEAFTNSKLWHREIVAPKNVYTEGFTLIEEGFTPSTRLHKQAVTQRSLYTQPAFPQWHLGLQLQNRISTPKPQRTILKRCVKEIFKTLHFAETELQTQKNNAQRPQKLQVQTRISTTKPEKDDFEALCERNFQNTAFCRDWVANTEEQRAEATETAGPNPDLDDKAGKRRFWSAFCKEFDKGNAGVQTPSHPWCSHANTIYNSQLHKTFTSRVQAQQRGTLTQPLRCDLQRLSGNTQKHSIDKKRQEVTWTPQFQRRHSPTRIRLNATMTAVVAQASQLFSAAECLLTKNGNVACKC